MVKSSPRFGCEVIRRSLQPLLLWAHSSRPTFQEATVETVAQTVTPILATFVGSEQTAETLDTLDDVTVQIV
jgi:hypothetical protein